MKIITHNDISKLGISPLECVKWAQTVIRNKNDYMLPPKISLKPRIKHFFNTMPCVIPECGCFGIKVVSRFPNRVPTLDSQILIYNLERGNLEAIMDGNWITAWRTGAVATTAIELLAPPEFNVVGIIGLGNTARATIECMLAKYKTRNFHFILRRHKNQEIIFQERISYHTNVSYEYVGSNQELIERSQVLLSCITATDVNLGMDEWYPRGILVVPIHTRGFQNCDLFFDKIFGDDTGHIQDFKGFSQFRQYSELTEVLQGLKPGRENADERILSYNIGIAVQDVYFAAKILSIIGNIQEVGLLPPREKYWV